MGVSDGIQPLQRTGTIVLLVLLVCLSPANAKIVPLDTSFDQPVSSGVGGRSVLVEELTATWCPSCAEIDPELMQVADSHGSRVALIALHPSDGEDAFQPEAGQHRIDRLMAGNDDLALSTPTFVVEGGEPRVGYDAWVEVQKDILDAELQRQAVTELAFEVKRNGTGYIATVTHGDTVTNAGQFTFILLQHEKPMPEGFVNPGEPTRDRVAVATAECTLVNDTIVTAIGFTTASPGDGCTKGFSVEFEAMTSWSLLLIHEATLETVESQGNLPTYGAVELAFRDRAEQPESSALEGGLLVACAALAVAGILRKK